MSKSRKNKKQSNLSKVLSHKPGFARVKYFHEQLSYDEIEKSIGTFANAYDFSKQINLSCKPNFHDFYNINIPHTSFRVNLAWCVGLVLFHKDKLSYFCELEEKLQQYILSDEYLLALNILDKIDSTCGVSTWSLGIRGSILKLSGNDLEHSVLLKNIMEDNKYNDFFKTICKYTIDRYDDNFLHISLAESFKKQLIRTLDDDLSSFLVYKITPKDYLSDFEIDFNNVLNYEKRSSVVDVYKALISLIESNITNYINNQIPFYLKNAILKLRLIGYQPILENAVEFYNLDTQKKYYKFNYKMADLYTQGYYREVVNESLILEHYDNFNLFEITSRAITRTEYNPYSGLKEKIINDIATILLKKENYHSAYYSLLNFCYAFSGLSWFRELQLFVSKESQYSRENINKILEYWIVLNSREDTPKKLPYLYGENKKNFIEYLEQLRNESITADFFLILELKDICENFDNLIPQNIDHLRIKKYKAVTYLYNGLGQQAISLLEDIISTGSVLDSYDGLKFLMSAYIENHFSEKAIKMFVEYVLSNEKNILIFDVEKIALAARDLVNQSKAIEVPICLSLYCKYVNDKFESTLRVSFEKFLENNQLHSPYDLFEKNLEYTEDKINYFLEHVCTPNNMKLSLFFSNKEEIDACRIKICNGLIEKGISRDTLIEETKTITKEEIFKQASAQVDQSRIYVDPNLFKDSRSNTVREIFRRFCKLKEQDYSHFDDEQTLMSVSKIFTQFEQENIFDIANSMHVMNVGLNEKNKTFHKLISMMRDEFTFGEKGLNTYLSTRIRHGVLPTALRKVIQNENLWTVLDLHTNAPRESMYWISKLPNINSREKKILFQYLFKFSKAFDSIIDEINDSWLQIVSLDQDISSMKKGGSKSKALFNYSISIPETYLLQCAITEDYNTLADIVWVWLWHKTDVNLKMIRGSIESNALNLFTDIFNDLEKDIQSLDIEDNSIKLLLSSIRKSREVLSNQLKNIASWFKKSSINQMNSFELNTAIDIAARSTAVKINLENCPDIKIKGRFLSSFVDIFYIIFENALSKSKLSNESLCVNISIYLQEEDLIILFKNNCQPVDYKIHNQQLDYYRQAYNNSELTGAASQQEGGTGIFKINNIINKDFNVEHSNDFGYLDEITFRTEIILKNAIKVITYENINS